MDEQVVAEREPEAGVADFPAEGVGVEDAWLPFLVEQADLLQDFALDEQTEAAQVMMDLMEWAGNQSDYSKTALYATISSLVNPASIIYTEYAETYREVKREKGANQK